MIWKHQLFSISSCPFEMYANLFFLNLLIYLAVLGSISTSFFTSRNRFRPQWSTEATEKNQDVSQSHLSVFGVLGTRGQYKGVGVVCRLWLLIGYVTSMKSLKTCLFPPIKWGILAKWPLRTKCKVLWLPTLSSQWASVTLAFRNRYGGICQHWHLFWKITL